MTISYGKEAIAVYRTDGVRTLFAAELAVEVLGEDFMPAYTAGDNSLVVPTDTMKNFVHATALRYGGESLEELAELVARGFLDTYAHVRHVTVCARELPFARHTDVLFQRVQADSGVAEIELHRERGIVRERSGRVGLQLVKLSGSSFAGFPRDGYTTLPEMVDRALFVHLDVHWRHAEPASRVSGTDVRAAVVETFDGFVSLSIQHLVHEMGLRLLERFPAIREVSFVAENRLWDTAVAGVDDPRVKVYCDPRPPYGRITLTLGR